MQVPTFCGKDCGGGACPLLATVENGRVTHISNNPAGGRYLKGCRRGMDLARMAYAPERLLTPLVRSGPRGSGQFRPASWDEALQITAQQLGEVRARYGATSVLNLSSAGGLGALHNTVTLIGRFLSLFGGSTNLSGSYSNAAARFVLPYLLGGRSYRVSGWDAATLQYSEMIILWGANILDTRLGSEIPQRLVEARKRGAQIVVIDPRRSATVKQAATWWLQIRPGTDAALMLAVLHTWVVEGLINRSALERLSVGFEQLEQSLLTEGRSAEWAAEICGIPADEIRRFARAYAAARPAMLLPGYSIQRVYAGEETYRLSVTLQVASGNFGVRGGSTGSLNSRLPTPRVGEMPIPALPADQQPTLPVVRWPDAILEGRKGGYPSDIHAVYNLGGNFINQGSDVHKNVAAFQAVDFAVSHELFLTPTARYCDVVLPAASPLEKADVGIPWLGNYLLYKPQVIAPLGQARSDYDIFCDLAERLGFGAAFSEGRSAADWVELFIQQSEIEDVEAFRRSGIYLAADQERVGLADFAADPQAHPLDTPSGRVEIASQSYQADTGFPAIPTWQQPPTDSRYPLRLISPKSALFTHSQGVTLADLRTSPTHAHRLEIHPQDAAARGIAEGSPVYLFNEHGRVRVPARLSEDVLPGVVSLPEGMWAALDESGTDTAGAVNLLTSTQGTAPGVACIMHAVPVEVESAVH